MRPYNPVNFEVEKLKKKVNQLKKLTVQNILAHFSKLDNVPIILG